MLKTNSKKAMENIRATIQEEANCVLEEREIVTNKPITEYFKIINEEKFYQKYPNDFGMVKDWMQGLGGGFFSSQVYLHNASKVVADWLEETEEESQKYTEQQAEELAVKLFFREMQKMIALENK